MAYEIQFTYTAKGDGPDKTFKKVVGTPDEDTPLEAVVRVITRQLARRDILVKGVAVYEFTKKKVRFKEIKNGVLLKDRKFLFDEEEDGGWATAPAGDEPPVRHPHELVSIPRPVAPTRTPMRMVVYDPDPIQKAKVPASYQLVPGRKYPVLREETIGSKLSPMTMYVVKDDRGVEVNLSADYFTAPGAGLLGGFDTDPVDGPAPTLLFAGKYQEDRAIPVGEAAGRPADLMAVPDLSKLRGKV
jgi:hypothetical protein